MQDTQIESSSGGDQPWLVTESGIEIDPEYVNRLRELWTRAVSPAGVFGSLEDESDVQEDEDLFFLEDGSLLVRSATTSDRALLMDVPPGHWSDGPDGIMLDDEYRARWRLLCFEAAQPGGVLHGVSPEQIEDEMAVAREDGSLLFFARVTGPGDLSLIVPPGHWRQGP